MQKFIAFIEFLDHFLSFSKIIDFGWMDGWIYGRTDGWMDDFCMFYQIFRSPQMKRGTIIRNKQGIHELPQELQNDLRLKVLGN